MGIEDKENMENYRIVIVGEGDFANVVNTSLLKAGFKRVAFAKTFIEEADIAIDVTMEGNLSPVNEKIPIVYPFDFIAGGAAMVVLPEDRPDFEKRGDIRLRVARYMAGYCAFWNIGNCGWLDDALPRIEKGEHSLKGMAAAAIICTRISYDLAVGSDVKHFPRFYLGVCEE